MGKAHQMKVKDDAQKKKAQLEDRKKILKNMWKMQAVATQNQRLTTEVKQLREVVRLHQMSNKTRGSDAANKARKNLNNDAPRSYQVGDRVLARTFAGGK